MLIRGGIYLSDNQEYLIDYIRNCQSPEIIAALMHFIKGIDSVIKQKISKH
ncbi:hypothetical protein M2145_002572 [Lachnospiraceae bacterium PF1-21]